MESDKSELARNLMNVFKQVHKDFQNHLYKSIVPNQKMTPMFVMMRLKRASCKGADGVRVSDIATSIGITVPAITQIITVLEKDGYVRRTMDPDDRRAVRVILTPAGDAMLEPAIRALDEVFISLIDYLGEDESKTLMNLLDRVECYFKEKKGYAEIAPCQANQNGKP